MSRNESLHVNECERAREKREHKMRIGKIQKEKRETYELVLFQKYLFNPTKFIHSIRFVLIFFISLNIDIIAQKKKF